MQLFNLLHKRPILLCASAIIVTVGLVLGFTLLRPEKKTPYQHYEQINLGDSFFSVTKRLGQPAESHATPNGIDYLFDVPGNPNYPVLMGVPFPCYRIIRVQASRVISKGPYEDYYHPYGPRWSEKKQTAAK